jgi:hypothetical protein
MPNRLRQLNFTRANIDAVTPPSAGRDYYNDSKVRGLQLQVTPTGAKTFFLYGRINGKPVRYRLGAYPKLTPEAARTKADVERGRVAKGIDIRAERKADERKQVTLEDAFKAFRTVRKTLRPKRSTTTAATSRSPLRTGKRSPWSGSRRTWSRNVTSA